MQVWPLSEIAHHFFEAAPGGSAEPAITSAKRAAERAHALLAFEERARLYEQALEALAIAAPEDAERRFELGGAVAGALDVIDWDELRTGERKEGVYFAAWHLAEKLALGVAAAVTGLALASSGFVPNQSQPGTALLAMRLLLSLFPLACYAVGSFLFLGFGLDRAEHTRVQREIATKSCVAAA